MKKQETKCIIKFSKDSKTDLKSEIWLMVYDLRDLLIYINSLYIYPKQTQGDANTIVW